MIAFSTATRPIAARRAAGSPAVARPVAASVVAACLALAAPPAMALELEPVAGGLTAPIDLVDPQDGSGRLFVLEQHGLVSVIGADGALAEETLLDLRGRLLPLKEDFEERGLLGIALPPDFAENPRLFVSYSQLGPEAPKGWNCTRRISEIGIDAKTGRADPASERVLISLDWPSRKHNGSGLVFGADGYLSIGLGDGGGVHGRGPDISWSAFDVPPQQTHWDRLAQDTDSLFGSILRIDPDHGFPGYASPEGNPFVGGRGRDEIYAWGFRNPHRIALDRVTGDLLVTTPAETLWEAIYLVRGPANFGWTVREGTHCMDRTRPYEEVPCEPLGAALNGFRLERPVVEYPNMQVMSPESRVKVAGVGTAVTGARIYRGSALPELYGKLIFSDWSEAFGRPSGQIFVATPVPVWGDPRAFERVLTLDAGESSGWPRIARESSTC